MSVAKYLTDIANYIRMRLETTEKYKLENMEEGIHAVFEKAYSDGERTGYDMGYSHGTGEGYANAMSEFWEVYQSGGKTKSYIQAFANPGWTDETYNPKYPIKGTQFLRCFTYSTIIDTKVPIMVETNTANVLASIFSGVTTLKIIRGLSVRETNTFNTSFQGCTALENITVSGVIGNDFDIHWSPLNRASIESIINTLSATVSGKTLTLNKTAVNKAFGIDVDNTATYPEGTDFYILRHSKDNWAFNYLDE